ncbi:MAG: hypothetical protein JO133_11180 [Burkholderiaceae bacterium]|nr:hypothetical protein [Burkholderiaceae bacterium]
MHPQVSGSGQAARKDETWAVMANRVLRQLFDGEPSAINESTALSDFEGCTLRDGPPSLSAMAWRIRVKDLVFSCFGVDCDIDEPLSSLVARIELAERGVRCTL